MGDLRGSVANWLGEKDIQRVRMICGQDEAGLWVKPGAYTPMFLTIKIKAPADNWGD